jgi:hypothetical protein
MPASLSTRGVALRVFKEENWTETAPPWPPSELAEKKLRLMKDGPVASARL